MFTKQPEGKLLPGYAPLSSSKMVNCKLDAELPVGIEEQWRELYQQLLNLFLCLHKNKELLFLTNDRVHSEEKLCLRSTKNSRRQSLSQPKREYPPINLLIPNPNRLKTKQRQTLSNPKQTQTCLKKLRGRDRPEAEGPGQRRSVPGQALQVAEHGAADLACHECQEGRLHAGHQALRDHRDRGVHGWLARQPRDDVPGAAAGFSVVFFRAVSELGDGFCSSWPEESSGSYILD